MGVSVDNRVKTIWLMHSGEEKNPNVLSDCFHGGIQRITKILQYHVGSDSAGMDKLRVFT